MSKEAKDAKEEAPKKKGKLPIIILAAVLLLGGGGAGAWFFLKPGHDAGEAEHAEKEKPKRKAASGPPVFVSIDPFLFNLRDENQDRFAQIAIVLQVEDASVEGELKTVAPAVRNALLMLMSSKSSDELLTVRGKEELSYQVVDFTNAIMAGERPPRIESPRDARGRSQDRGRDKDRAREIVSSKEPASGQAAPEHSAGADSNDRRSRDDRGDSYDDRYDDRRDRRRAPPERVIAAHFSQFIIQ